MKFHLAALTALVSSAALSAAAAEPKLVLKARNYYSYGYENGATEGLPNGKQLRFGCAVRWRFAFYARIEMHRLFLWRLMLPKCTAYL